jgi:DNA transposition AAA+ family ATPase
MKTATVPIKNVARLAQAAESLINASPDMPRMGVVYGRSGFGKTTAVAWMVNNVRGLYVRAMATSTPSSLLAAISKECFLEPRNSCAQMVDRIIEYLARTQRPIFIDEGDYLVDSKRMTETLRDLHDLAVVPVVLVGMEHMVKKLQMREQLYNRLAQQVRFEAADFQDARLLADKLCEVKIEDDLLKRVYNAPEVGGVVRRLVVALAHIESRARIMGVQSIDAAAWGSSGNFFTNEPAEATTRGGKVSVLR